MNAHEPDRERTARLNRDHMTRRLDGPVPNLETLSISELESLLAEKRRRESKRILRVIAGRAANEAPAGPAPPQTSSLGGAAALVRKGRLTRRLLAEEVRAALGRPPAGGWTSPPPPADRFRRSSLAAPARPHPQRGPAWVRQASVRKGVDLGLQLAELGFVLLFLYVVAQWLFADAQTDMNIDAEMTPVAAPVSAPARPAAQDDDGPLKVVPLAPDTPIQGLPKLAVPAAPAGAGVLPFPAAPNSLDRGGREDAALQNHGLTIPVPLTQTATLSQTTTTITDTLSGTAGTPAPAGTGVESNPAQTTEIRIPGIKLDARVREVQVKLDTWEWEVADFMAGHHTGTANPGELGNVVIAGHRDIRGSVFLHLDQVKKGDSIYLYSGRGVFHYIVRTTKIVLPTAVQVMAPTTDHRLTLITCTPVKIASHRLIVIADLDPNYTAPDRGK